MTDSFFLSFLAQHWLWLAATALLAALITAVFFQRRLHQANTRLALYRHELDKQAQLFAAETQHHEQRLSELQAARQQLAERFDALSKQALQDNNRHFLDLAGHFFQVSQQQAKADLTQRQEAIQLSLLPVKEALAKLETHTQHLAVQQTGAYHQLQEQIRGLTGLQHSVQQETGRLVEAIRKPHIRGRWGEMTLRRVLESAGMLINSDFIEQFATEDNEQRQLRPDVVIRLPEGRSLVVDAKAPFDAYLNVLHAENDEQRRTALEHHARQVRTHIKLLGSKAYWESLPATPEFVVLFIPGESVFSAALEADPGLLENGWQNRVVLATPTSLVATVMAVAYSWKQEAMARNAEIAIAHGRDLYDRLCTFTQHLQDAGKGLSRAVGSYNQAVASLESRVLPKARRFEELSVTASGKSLPDVPPIEALPRTVEPIQQDAA